MKKSELIRLLSSSEEDEVYIETDEATYDIEIDHIEQQFDGFATVYPASIALRPVDLKEEEPW